jgi:hypothetical protein
VDGIATHSAHFGIKLQEHCAEFGVTCELVYPGAGDVNPETITESLIARLKAPAEEVADWQNERAGMFEK